MIGSVLTSADGIVAIAAGAVAIAALLLCFGLALALRRVQRRQRLVLGEHDNRDIVAHSASLSEEFSALESYVLDAAERIERRLATVEGSLRHTISQRSLIHYDAYNETSGRQSMSIALLDPTRTGLVITCIHHRDQARVYAKQVNEGEGESELSPEEAEAVQLAVSSPATDDAAQRTR